MATESKIQLSLKDRAVMSYPGATVESAAKASEILQENHEQHHIFTGPQGFHVSSVLIGMGYLALNEGIVA